EYQIGSNEEEVEIFGKIKDGKNGNTLPGVILSFKNAKTNVISDLDGSFRISIPRGEEMVSLKAPGFEVDFKKIYVQSSGALNLEMYERLYKLDEVTISAEGEEHNLSAMEAGKVNVEIKTIKKLPAFLGEVDVVKSLLILPGVSSSAEGTSGINVRGGNSDQNLVLMDGIPVFNSAHLFGFFSSINSDLVRNVTLYKGAAPAEFGGKASSVMNIGLRTGDMQKIKGSGGLGLVTSRIALEGPIVKEKASFLLAGRSSYSNWLLKSIKNAELTRSSASFYDLNGKFDFIINDKNRLSINSYRSKDSFQLAFDSVYNWSSTALSLIWNKEMSDKWYSTLKGGYSDYQNNIEGKSPAREFTLGTGFQSYGIYETIGFDNGRNFHLKAGGSFNYHRVNPGLFIPGENSILDKEVLENKKSMESALFVQNQFDLTPNLGLMLGLRYTWYSKLGEPKEYIYASDTQRENASIVDTLIFESNNVSKTYQGLEPRVSIKYMLNDISSLKLGYSRNRQFFQLVSNNVGINPFSFWTSSDRYLPPIIGDQLSLGYYRDLQQLGIEASAEVYYKKLQNIVDYKNGAELLMNEHLEQDLISGDGKSYGLELLLKKVSGRLTGYFSYTYSRSYLQMDSPIQEERVNDGAFYPSNFDKPHDFSLATRYNITKRWSFNANFVYSSGRPITFPDATYKVDGYTFSNYSDRNAYRVPDYHRLDVSLTVEGNHKKVKKWDSSWTFSVFNLYAKKNAYSVFFMKKSGEPMQAYKLS
ncbi:TonB-dependent receptor, partial [Xanthovirga aplysinae]|uniref:TonB-dependent receptor n=1 Tax=Xanthovirga aplysinae TaxID=2529853 RepID=UPI001CA45638